MILKHKCKTCNKSGKGPHQRCDEYFRIKGINDKHREEKALSSGYYDFKRDVIDKERRISY